MTTLKISRSGRQEDVQDGEDRRGFFKIAKRSRCEREQAVEEVLETAGIENQRRGK